MAELRSILDLAKRASDAQEDVCVATVVGIEGSAYRRPGARMLLTRSGVRAGTVSGGCLEGEIAKKAWWLTGWDIKGRASIQRYSSFFDEDGSMPYGLGCGGTVIVLIERGEPATQTLTALRRSVEDREPWVVVIDTSDETPGTALVMNGAGEIAWQREGAGDSPSEAEKIAADALAKRLSGRVGRFFVEYLGPPPSLIVFGAGDDAKPLVEFMAELDWHVTVADGRTQLLRPARFPRVAQMMELQGALGEAPAADAAVVMTHSYEQDRQILRTLLPLGLRYLGILGPRRRTERLVSEIAPGLGLTDEECMARLRSPVGMDLGGHSPSVIALSIAAELQTVVAGRGAEVRSAAPAHV